MKKILAGIFSSNNSPWACRLRKFRHKGFLQRQCRQKRDCLWKIPGTIYRAFEDAIVRSWKKKAIQ